MKKIFLLVTLVAGFVSAFAQNDDSTKYIWYKFQYGFRQPRVQADSIMTVPRDTAHNAKYGSLAVKKDTLYFKDSTKWVQASTDLSKLPFISIDKRSLYDSIGKVYFTGPTPTEVKLKAQLQDEGGIGTRDRNVGGALTTDTTTAHTIDAYTVGANSVANVRTIALPSNLFHIRLSDQQRKFIQDYQYDASDVSTADDGIFTLVGPGGQRYKAVIKDYIDARLFGLDVTLGNNATALQAAVTAASTYSGTHTVLIANGSYPVTSNITVPAGVTLKFVEGGMLSGTDTITGGIIDGPMRAQLFTTGVTVRPDAVPTVFSMMWYGAKGDGSDEVLKLQKCLDVCAYANKIKHLYWPKGNYVGSKGLFWERDDNGDGSRDFLVGYTLEGETKGFDGGALETSYTVANGNSFGFGIQKGKGVVIKNIFLLGNNGAIGLLTPVAVMENSGTNWTNGNSDNQVWPHAGWAIDPVAGPGTLSGSKYTDFSAKYTDASNSGSTDILIENCGARYWVVGFIISPQGVIQNGDHVEFRNCWADFNKVAFATGSTQNRTNKITHCAVWGHVKTIIDCNTYGDNSGDPPHVSELNCAGYNRELCRLNSFFNAGLFIKDSHFELLQMLGGNFAAQVGDLFMENSFINLAGDNNPGDGTQVHHAKTIFRGGELSLTNCKLTNYSQGLGLHAFAAANAVFVNSTFDTYPLNNLLTGQTQFIHCRSGAFSFGEGERVDWVDPIVFSNQPTLFVTDMNYVTQLGTRDIFSSVTRKKINRTLGNGGYGFKDAQQIPLGGIAVTNVQDPELAVGYSHCEFTLSTSSAEFKYIQVGDIVITYSTDEYGRTNVYHTFGTVLSKNGSTGLVVIRDLCAGVTATTYSLFLYKAQKLIPVFATGNTTSGSTTISSVLIEENATSFPTNVLLNSPFFPEGTVILSYNNGTGQITTSNPATATANNIDILSSNWQGVVYSGPPSPTQVDKIGWKQGDICWNTRVDVDSSVLFWVCSTSGITNTARQPTFRPVFKQQPPPLANDAAADTYGIQLYYDSTNHILRFKNNGTWLTAASLTGTEVFTNKTLTTPTIASFVNATHNHQNAAGGGTLAEAALALTDITTNNVSTSAHGFMPKLTNVAGNYFDATGSYNNTYIWRHTTVNNAITSITGGTGEGTSGSRALAGGDVGGKITITTGTGPTASATVETIVFSAAYASAPYVLLTPANAAAAALTGNGQVYISSTSTTQFVITAGSTNLVASTQYIWYYQVVQ